MDNSIVFSKILSTACPIKVLEPGEPINSIGMRALYNIEVGHIVWQVDATLESRRPDKSGWTYHYKVNDFKTV